MNDPRAVTFIGTTDYRNQATRFGIRAKDRLQHMYIIGKSGVGKSTLLENMIVQDIQSGNGCAFFDPHGKSAELLLQYVPEHRVKDVIYFAPFDTDFPIAFNPLEHDDYTEQNQRNFIADSLLAAFKKIWGAEKFSDRMEYILSMTLLALLEYPESTLLGINRMYSDKEFRARVVESVTDITVKSFWTQTFATWDPKYAREATAAIENKIGQLSSNPLIRNIVGQTKSSFDFRQVIDSKKIFIANLSIGRIGEQNTSLLGAMLMSKLYLAAMSRADRSESEMADIPPFYLFVDEFQNFANESFENILSQARKYKLGLTVAHQYVEQMPEMLRFAILGNVGTMCTFRIGPDDAELFEKQFSPVFTAEDLVNLAPYQVYLSLLIDGLGSKPFSARTLAPIPKPDIDCTQSIIYNTRGTYSYQRREVEAAIAAWYAPIPTKKDLDHQLYLEKKKNDLAAQGVEWTPEVEPEYVPRPASSQVIRYEPKKAAAAKLPPQQPAQTAPPQPILAAQQKYPEPPKPVVIDMGAVPVKANPPVVIKKQDSVPIPQEPEQKTGVSKIDLSEAFMDFVTPVAPVHVPEPIVQAPVMVKTVPAVQQPATKSEQQRVFVQPIPKNSSPVIPRQIKHKIDTATVDTAPEQKKVIQNKTASVESVSRLKEILEKATSQKNQGLPPAPQLQKIVAPVQQNNSTLFEPAPAPVPEKSVTVSSSDRPEITPQDLAKILGTTDTDDV